MIWKMQKIYLDLQLFKELFLYKFWRFFDKFSEMLKTTWIYYLTLKAKRHNIVVF
jgi:hypothetical protein